MSSPAPDKPHSIIELRSSQATAVIVQRVPPDAEDWFMEWERGITAAAESAAGYRGTILYAPAPGHPEEWVVLMHFDDDPSLQQWLVSPIRAEWVKKRHDKLGQFELKLLPGGFGPWFAGIVRGPRQPPPSWKMALTVLLGLYPTVMLLNILLGPHTQPLGLAVSVLIGNALSIATLQWIVMPVLTPLLARWLEANEAGQKAHSIGGLLLILLGLAGLAVVFWLVKG